MRRKLALVALIAPVLIAAAPDDRPAVQHFRPEGAVGPFSAAVRVGDMLYLSGAIGRPPDGTLPEGFEAQARQMMDNVRAALALAGRGFDDVVRCTVMLENMADWPAFNRIYATYFSADRLPARSAFGADGLALGALVELECQAYAPAGG